MPSPYPCGREGVCRLPSCCLSLLFFSHSPLSPSVCACVWATAVLSVFGASSLTVESGVGEAGGGRQGKETLGSSETRKLTRRGPHVLNGQQRMQACVRERFTMMSILEKKVLKGGRGYRERRSTATRPPKPIRKEKPALEEKADTPRQADRELDATLTGRETAAYAQASTKTAQAVKKKKSRGATSSARHKARCVTSSGLSHRAGGDGRWSGGSSGQGGQMRGTKS